MEVNFGAIQVTITEGNALSDRSIDSVEPPSQARSNVSPTSDISQVTAVEWRQCHRWVHEQCACQHQLTPLAIDVSTPTGECSHRSE